MMLIAARAMVASLALDFALSSHQTTANITTSQALLSTSHLPAKVVKL